MHTVGGWLEAAAAANLVGMIPQGDSFHNIGQVAGHTYQCRSGAMHTVGDWQQQLLLPIYWVCFPRGVQ